MVVILIVLILGINSNQSIFTYSFNEITRYMTYDIYQSINPVAAIFRIYGGGIALHGEIESRSCLANYLLNSGISLIYLNGEDIYKNRNRNKYVSADDINATLHGITAFREWFITIFAYNIKKTILYGTSYGGGVIMKHAEMFPNTFDGYISHAGFINPEYYMDISIGHISDSALYHKMLSVDCSRIESPILLLHNEYDNIVPSGASYGFYSRCKRSGKKNICILINKQLIIKPHSDQQWCNNLEIIKFIKLGIL